jgi:hypothetical protein
MFLLGLIEDDAGDQNKMKNVALDLAQSIMTS